MAWINDTINNIATKQLRLSSTATTYPAFYKYWIEQLSERLMRLFIWKNTEPVPPKEIEQRQILQGWTGIAKEKGVGELTAYFGAFHGPTKYYDEWNKINVYSPVWSGEFTIGVNCEIIENNSTRNRSYDLVHHYATLLAHVDVSIVNCLVNSRKAGGSPVVNTQKQKEAVGQYYTELYNGKYGSILDSSMLGIEWGGQNTQTQQDITALIETKERIYKNFLNDIGVRSSFTKRSNTVEAEVDADSRLLLLNLSDMLESRKKGCEKVNELFGTNWSVELNPEIDYTQEIDGYDETESETTETETETQTEVEVNENES